MTRALWLIAATAVLGPTMVCAQSAVPSREVLETPARYSREVRVASALYKSDNGQSIAPLGEGLAPPRAGAVPQVGSAAQVHVEGGTDIPQNVMAVPDANGLRLLQLSPSNPASGQDAAVAAEAAPASSAKTGGLRTFPAMGMGSPAVVTGETSPMPVTVEQRQTVQDVRRTGGLRLLPPTASTNTENAGSRGIVGMDEGLPAPQSATGPEPMLTPMPVPAAAIGPQGAVRAYGGSVDGAIPAMGSNVVPPKQDAPYAQYAPKGINVPGPVFDPNASPADVTDTTAAAENTTPGEIPAMDGVPLPEPKAVTAEELDAALNKVAPKTRLATAQEIAMDKNPRANEIVNVPGFGPALALRDVDLPGNGQCQTVHPGDRVHFTLRVENAQSARHVFTHLQLALAGHARFYRPVGLPLYQGDAMGGGGTGERDANDGQLYHFSFLVPMVETGIYRTRGIDVRAIYGRSSADPGVSVPLDRNSREQVKVYCLAVFGGTGNGDQRPIVTEFLPDPVEHAAVPVDEPVFSQPY